MRGKTISYSSCKKKQEQQAIIDLEKNIKELTEKYAKDPKNDLLNKLQKIRTR